MMLQWHNIMLQIPFKNRFESVKTLNPCSQDTHRPIWLASFDRVCPTLACRMPKCPYNRNARGFRDQRIQTNGKAKVVNERVYMKGACSCQLVVCASFTERGLCGEIIVESFRILYTYPDPPCSVYDIISTMRVILIPACSQLYCLSTQWLHSFFID